MKASNSLWKENLSGRLPEDLAQEVDVFEAELGLRKLGKLDERLIAETRLRRGVYGQRYDNGQRHDGRKVQEFAYPSGHLTKGPHTLWDAPGMQRIKIPAGGLNAAQLETLAELAEEYSDGIAHITTRQDVQLHYVHIDDTPTIMRRLAAAGITTREACGNTVRNVTACPFAGICQDEVFDVTPYARALSRFLLGHPDCQSFGRKFKPSFSGCVQHACGLANMHDLGLVGVKRIENGEEVRFARWHGRRSGARRRAPARTPRGCSTRRLLEGAALCRSPAAVGAERRTHTAHRGVHGRGTAVCLGRGMPGRARRPPEWGVSRSINAASVVNGHWADYRPALLLTRQLAAVGRALLASRGARAIDRIDVSPGDAFAGAGEALLASAALGVLAPVVANERLNLISARALSTARGIALSVTAGEALGDAGIETAVENRGATYSVAVRLTSGRHDMTVAGVAHPEAAPRITRIGAFHVNVQPRETLLILTNRDVPGVIGHVGMALGAAGVNIAEYHQARLAQGGEALAAVAVDGSVEDSLRIGLLALPDVLSATVIPLPIE